MKLIIVANRLPVKIVEESGTYEITRSNGGLATGLDSLTMSGEKHWVGWPGMYIEDEEQRKKLITS
ncbi:MAG: hypothetical protein LUD15_04440 [Bacteroides sp.]|nr:hypothetical protein [Bacteroides sp.]